MTLALSQQALSAIIFKSVLRFKRHKLPRQSPAVRRDERFVFALAALRQGSLGVGKLVSRLCIGGVKNNLFHSNGYGSFCSTCCMALGLFQEL